MTPQQLRNLRDARSMSREELAAVLQCSASAIVQWEGGTRPIPPWVEDKMLRTADVTLPLDELQQLIDLSIERGQPFTELLTEAIRAFIRTADPPRMKETATKEIPFPKPPQNPAHTEAAAEEPGEYKVKRKSK